MIEPGDTRAIIGMGSDLACYVGSCSACNLGSKSRIKERSMGYGYGSADIMIIADASNDASYNNPGALDIFMIGAEGQTPRPKFVAVHDIILDLGLDPTMLYTTTAFKCRIPYEGKGRDQFRRRWGSHLSRKQMMPCLTRHLGIELEIVQPAVVICYGIYAAQFLWAYFPLSDLPSTLKKREKVSIPTPSSWRYDELLIVRSPKHDPRQAETRNLKGVGTDVESIRWAFETARDYTRDELESHRRRA